jgi:sulfate adenylyltransferase subunit 1 (EFTu-like GTPase family)
VLDAFQAERDQAVTIDTTQIWFKTALREGLPLATLDDHLQKAAKRAGVERFAA